MYNYTKTLTGITHRVSQPFVHKVLYMVAGIRDEVTASCALILTRREFALYKSFTYLLTYLLK